jgi:hypothetical protein
MIGGMDTGSYFKKNRSYMISREAIIWTVGAWFGGSLVGLVMSMMFSIIISRMER